jgi:hypothetical protein
MNTHENEWETRLSEQIHAHIREGRGDLLLFLDALAEDALQRGSWDELYEATSS